MLVACVDLVDFYGADQFAATNQCLQLGASFVEGFHDHLPLKQPVIRAQDGRIELRHESGPGGVLSTVLPAPDAEGACAVTDFPTPPETACVSCGGGPIFVKKRLLCRLCYNRWQRYRDPAAGGPRQGLTPLERFNYYVPDQSDPLGCWIWTGPTLGREVCDYGRLFMGDDAEQRLVLVHRWSYEHFVEAIPDGCEIDHVKNRGCRSTLCVNPAHLEPVTHKVNVERGESPSAQHARKECCPQCGGPYAQHKGKRRCLPCYNARAREWMLETGRTTGEGKGARHREKTHCTKKHEYTPENTYVNPKTGGRDCQICRAERRERSKRKMRGLAA
jgi:HNH endonuclease